jgi:hypothetical protein
MKRTFSIVVWLAGEDPAGSRLLAGAGRHNGSGYIVAGYPLHLGGGVLPGFPPTQPRNDYPKGGETWGVFHLG